MPKTVLLHDLREISTFVGYTAVSLGHGCKRHPLRDCLCVFRGRISSFSLGKASLQCLQKWTLQTVVVRVKEFVLLQTLQDKSKVFTQSDTCCDGRIHPAWRRTMPQHRVCVNLVPFALFRCDALDPIQIVLASLSQRWQDHSPDTPGTLSTGSGRPR